LVGEVMMTMSRVAGAGGADLLDGGRVVPDLRVIDQQQIPRFQLAGEADVLAAVGR
jgi:hypothetical protein